MQSKQYFTKIKNYPHEKSTEPIFPFKLLKGNLSPKERDFNNRTWFNVIFIIICWCLKLTVQYVFYSVNLLLINTHACMLLG